MYDRSHFKISQTNLVELLLDGRGECEFFMDDVKHEIYQLQEIREKESHFVANMHYMDGTSKENEPLFKHYRDKLVISSKTNSSIPQNSFVSTDESDIDAPPKEWNPESDIYRPHTNTW